MATWQTKNNKTWLWAAWIICGVYGVLCLYLYYMQAIQPIPMESQLFESDLPYHISMVIDDGWYYSLTAFIYQFLYFFPGANLLIALFLAAVTVATVCATSRLLNRFLAGRLPAAVILLLGLACNMIMPFYLAGIHRQRYIGYQSGSIWHNSTYICMKACAVFCLLLYLAYEEKYREGLSVREWLTFSVLLAVTAAVKPSFLMVFAPVMAIYLVVDMIKGVPFSKVFCFGATVLPSLLIILLQNSVLFGGDTGNGIAIRIGYVLSMHSDHPKVTIVLSLIFPLYIVLFNMKNLFRKKWYLASWMMFGFGFLEVLLFTETGERTRGANFMWGYAFCIFIAFTTAVIMWIQNYLDKEYIGKWLAVRWIYLGVGAVILGYHLYNGIVFFSKLVGGMTYWGY